MPHKNLKILNGEIVPKETIKARYESQLGQKVRDMMVRPSQDSLVESKIKVAIAKGKFKNLPGKGKPLDLSCYFRIPEPFRIAYHMLKNAGYLPYEVQLKKEIEEIKAKLRTCNDKEEITKLQKEFNEKTSKFGIIMDSYKTLR